MSGVNVSVTSETKLLGVIIDQDLKFHRHVTYATAKSQRVYRTLVRIARPTWGVKLEIIRIMYLRAIEPGLTYASNVWSNTLKFKYIRKELEQFQRPCAIRAARGFHTI